MTLGRPIALTLAACDRLDRALVAALSEALGATVSRKRVKALLDGGRVTIEGRIVRRANQPVDRPVEAFVDALPSALVPAPKTPPWTLDASRVLYRDDAILAVDKPAGLRTQASVAVRDDNLLEAVRRHLDGGYAALHHRLDRFTSGVVVLAIDRAANAGLARAFRERLATKTYRALCAPPSGADPGDGWVMEGDVRRRGAAGAEDDGRFGRTAFRVLARGMRRWLVEARPDTGRRHQIRIHLALAGMPIVGDETYGGPPDPAAKRHWLHHGALELAHPISGEPLRLEAPWPDALQGDP